MGCAEPQQCPVTLSPECLRSPFGLHPLQPPPPMSARSPYDTSQQGYKDWTFMSTHFWDENPDGTWTLLLENKGDAYNTGGHWGGTNPSTSTTQCFVPSPPFPVRLASDCPLSAPPWAQPLGEPCPYWGCTLGSPTQPDRGIAGPAASNPTSTTKDTGWGRVAATQHRVLFLPPPGTLTSFILHLHGTDEDMMARRFSAPTTAECTKWDAQGACEGERIPHCDFGQEGTMLSAPECLQAVPYPRSHPHPFAECSGSFYAYQRSCLSYCPPRSYGRSRSATHASLTCARCHHSCYTCQGTSANNCTSCPAAHTYDERTHSCSAPQGLSPQEGQHRNLLPIVLLLCETAILFAVVSCAFRTAWLCVLAGCAGRCWAGAR